MKDRKVMHVKENTKKKLAKNHTCVENSICGFLIYIKMSISKFAVSNSN